MSSALGNISKKPLKSKPKITEGYSSQEISDQLRSVKHFTILFWWDTYSSSVKSRHLIILVSSKGGFKEKHYIKTYQLSCFITQQWPLALETLDSMFSYQGQRSTQIIGVHTGTLPIMCQMLQFIEQWSITLIFLIPWQDSTGKSLNQRGVHWNTTSNEKKAYKLWTLKTSLKKKCGDNRGVWILLYRM